MLEKMQLFGPRVAIAERLPVVRSVDVEPSVEEQGVSRQTGSLQGSERLQVNQNAVLLANSPHEMAAKTTTYSSSDTAVRTSGQSTVQTPLLVKETVVTHKTDRVQTMASQEVIAPVSILGKRFNVKASTRYRGAESVYVESKSLPPRP